MSLSSISAPYLRWDHHVSWVSMVDASSKSNAEFVAGLAMESSSAKKSHTATDNIKSIRSDMRRILLL